jgi:glycosyltransferase involved in cell wall biosynthesis
LKKIILISPFPPAQNPRLVKEYKTLKANGYHVKVLYAERDQWASIFNEQLNSDFHLVGGKFNSIYYHLTRILHKLSLLMLPIEFAYNRISLIMTIKLLFNKADLYIAHNLAALPIGIKAAKFHNTKCGFDAEDFHRNEVTDDKNSKEYNAAKHIEDKFLPLVNYITAASPLIAQEYKTLYPHLKPVVIKNVFPIEFVNKVNVKSYSKIEPIRLFWFSQTLGKGRGLEDVIEALQQNHTFNFELHLLGNASNEVQTYLKVLAKKTKLHFYQPIPSDDIFKFASEFDIGLALEQNIPYNRDICLTNKIFTYLTAGLAIIASNTTGQKKFIEENIEIGKTYQIGNIKELSKILMFYYNNKTELFETKIKASKLALNELNWEKESEKFLNVIKTLNQ